MKLNQSQQGKSGAVRWSNITKYLELKRLWHGLLLGLLLIVFIYLLVFQLMSIWSFTVDDMYIPLRYAKNWVQEGRLLWNLNEPPVEGYSNFSFVLLGALAIKTGVDPVLVLKLVGVLGLVVTVITLYCLSRFWFTAGISLIPCFWLLLYKGQIIWAASGLETSVFQALLGCSLYFLLRGTGHGFYPNKNPYRSTNRLDLILAGIFLAFACLTRTEGPFLVVLFLCVAWFDWPKKTMIPRDLILTLGVFCLIYLPYFVWRWHYFGRIFPNPIYCKGLSHQFLFQLDAHYLKLVWPELVLSLWALWRVPTRCFGYFILPSVLYLILLVAADPVAAFDNRLFLASFALLLPLTLVGVKQIILILEPEEQSWVFATSMVVAALVFALFFIPGMSLAEYRKFTQMPLAGEHLRKTVLQWLEGHTKLTDEVVLGDSGMIPYFSPNPFIDSFCLNNRRMTQQPGPGMVAQFCTDLMQQKPPVIILASLLENGHRIYLSADVCLHQSLKNNRNYQLREAYKVGDNISSYQYEIYSLK